MIYYILLGMDTAEDIWDENILGEESFGTFYTGNGYKAFKNMIIKADWGPEVLKSIAIIDEKGNSYSIDEFLKLLQNWKIFLDND